MSIIFGVPLRAYWRCELVDPDNDIVLLTNHIVVFVLSYWHPSHSSSNKYKSFISPMQRQTDI